MHFDLYSLRTLLAVMLTVLAVSACGITPKDGPTVAYREAESGESLQTPPDLTRTSSSNAVNVSSDAEGDSIKGKLLPEFEGIEFVRSGGSSWLEVADVPPEKLWPRVDTFLRGEGLSIASRQPELGIIETGWAQRFDSPRAGGVTGFLGGLFDKVASGSVQDKYQVRLERMEEREGTRIFIHHRTAQEVDTSQASVTSADYAWAQSQGDPAIEAEMARRMLVHLGLASGKADELIADQGAPLQARARYELDGDAARIMVADPNPRRVYSRVGDALGDVGADIRSRDRERGIYVFDWMPPEDLEDDGGFFGWFGGDDEPAETTLEVRLFPEAGAIRIKAADEGGQARSGAVHRALLRQLAVAMGADPAAVREAEKTDDEGFFRGGRRNQEYEEPSR